MVSFVYEVISEEDNQKYKIAETLRKYHGILYVQSFSSFVVDRENNIFLLFLDHGREEFVGQTLQILFMDGIEIFLRLNLNSVSELNAKIKCTWNLVSASFPENSSVSDEKFKRFLRDALLVFGVGIPEYRHSYDVDVSF